MALDDDIPTAKHYWEHMYFIFRLGEPALLASKKIAYEYAPILRYPWHMKNGIKNFLEKHPGSIIILKIVNDTLRAWNKNHSTPMFWYYIRINKGHDHILMVDKATSQWRWKEAIVGVRFHFWSLLSRWKSRLYFRIKPHEKDVLCYPKRCSTQPLPFRILFKHFSFCKIHIPRGLKCSMWLTSLVGSSHLATQGGTDKTLTEANIIKNWQSILKNYIMQCSLAKRNVERHTLF